MNDIGNLHEEELPIRNIYILSNFIYHIPLLIVIIVLTIKAANFSKVRQSLSNISAMHCIEIKD